MFEYIESNSLLLKCCEKITKHKSISLDLEFDKNHYRYGFTLCLIQIKAGDEVYLIDPMADKVDLIPVFAVLENSEIEKVVYAFGEDIRLLHSVGCFPKNIYDLSITSRLLDIEAISLTNILVQELNIKTPKGAQKSNWCLRPLTDSQKEYAALDVEHLKELKLHLQKNIHEEIKRWIEEENSLYETITHEETEAFEPLKPKDKKDLTEYQWFILQGLIEFRESIAKEVNRPGHFILSKDYIREISIDHSKLKLWEKTRGIYKRLHNNTFKKQVQSELSRLIELANQNGLSKSAPAKEKLSEEERRLAKAKRLKEEKYILEVLKPIQEKIAKHYGNNTASFILSNRIMQQVASQGKELLPKYKQELLSRYGA